MTVHCRSGSRLTSPPKLSKDGEERQESRALQSLTSEIGHPGSNLGSVLTGTLGKLFNFSGPQFLPLKYGGIVGPIS